MISLVSATAEGGIGANKKELEMRANWNKWWASLSVSLFMGMMSIYLMVEKHFWWGLGALLLFAIWCSKSDRGFND